MTPTLRPSRSRLALPSPLFTTQASAAKSHRRAILFCQNPATLANFYVQAFGMVILDQDGSFLADMANAGEMAGASNAITGISDPFDQHLNSGTRPL
ncbi:hypothetical protein [Chitinimonas naiadis]